jgi:hemoglobin
MNNYHGIKFTGVMMSLVLVVGCATDSRKPDDYFTSGNRDADQRAEQRIAKDQQIKGKGDKGSSENKSGIVPGSEPEKKKSLFERLGETDGLSAIVDDFINRALADPRVNWERKGVKRSALSLTWKRDVEWKPSDENVARMKAHITQFLALATGGPAKYEGKEMKQTHAGLRITNTEFDAAVGDLKATLDKLTIPTQEQKELLAIVESTRPQIVEEK